MDDALELLHRFAQTIDAHDWPGLADLLADNFRCTLVHTGEVFDKASWVRLNAHYPGFESMTLEDAVASGDRAVGRASVVGRRDGVEERFQVASFLTVRDGLVVELVEVWTDIGQTAPEGTRERQ